MNIKLTIPEAFTDCYNKDRFDKCFMHIFAELVHTEIVGPREKDMLRMLQAALKESEVLDK